MTNEWIYEINDIIFANLMVNFEYVIKYKSIFEIVKRLWLLYSVFDICKW